METAGVD